MSRLRLNEGWPITFLLLAGMMLSVGWSIQRAEWSDHLTLLTPVTLAGVALGLVLARWRRVPSFVAHPLALVAGALLILDRLDPVLPLPANGHGLAPAARFLLERGRVWFSSTGTSRYQDDFYLFLLGLAAIMWVVSYGGAWLVFRTRWLWPALLLPAVVLLFNLGYAPSAVSSSLVLFLILALLLIAHCHFTEREAAWRGANINYPDSLGLRALWIGLVVAVLTIGFAWVAPFSARGGVLATAWERVNGPWQRLEGRFNEMFGSLNGSGARRVGNYASFGEQFQLGGPLKLSQTPILVLQGDQPYYLKARTYDTFDGQRWTLQPGGGTFNNTNNGQYYVPQIQLAAGQELAVPPPQASQRREMSVRMLAPRGNALFTANQFVGSSRDSYVQLSWTPRRFETDLATARAEDLPAELRRLYGLVREGWQSGQLRLTDDRGNPLAVAPRPTPTPLRPGAAGAGESTPTAGPTPTPFIPPPSAAERQVLDEVNALRDRLIQVRVVVKEGAAPRLLVNGQFPNYDDVEVVLPREGLQAGAQYQATTLVSTAVAPQLREAGAAYPEWIGRYLQTPPSLTARTEAEARRLATGKNPYDAALAIQNYLRETIAYKEDIKFPPANRDLVDYLLFESKEGYCEYYSTAMVMMLRSQGIPAREVVGFYSGEYDNQQLGFLYRESNAHAWVEVYFPGYGWIAFEPTSPRPPFDREPAPDPGGDPGGITAPNPDDPTAIGAGGEFPEDPAFGAGAGGGATPARPLHPALRALQVVVPLGALLAGLLALAWLISLRGLSPTSQFYARMTRSSALAGVRPPPGATPYEFARVVGARVPEAQRSLDRIADSYVRERYGGQRPTTQELRLVQRAWLTLRGALLKSLVNPRRRRDDGQEWG